MKRGTKILMALGLTGTTGVAIGCIGGDAMMKAAKSYTDNKVGQLLLYGVGATGLVVLAYPVIRNTAERLVDWAYKEEYKSAVKELHEMIKKHSKKEEESE